MRCMTYDYCGDLERSVERQEWVQLGELTIGERLQTRDGLVRVTGSTSIYDPQPVYNLEIHGQHVYEVTELGILVHNAGSDLLCDTIRTASEANVTNSGQTVLGHFPGYIEKAKARGASYFDIGDAWDSLSDAQRTAANQHFLDRIAANGDTVILSLPKTKIRPGSSLAWEVQYLITEKGYRWINQWSMVAP